MTSFRQLPPLTDFYTKRPFSTWEEVNPDLYGNAFCDLDGIPFRRGDPLKRQRRLPALFDLKRMLMGDLIPGTSWGASLANLLTSGEWEKLRRPVIQRNNSVREFCGTRCQTLDVHEEWSYTFPSEEDMMHVGEEGVVVFGVQRLDGLLGLCKRCHECFHLGLALAKGRLNNALTWMGGINGWSLKEGQQYYDFIYERHIRMSDLNWALDLGGITHPSGGFVVKSPWQRDDDIPQLLFAPSKVHEGETITIPLNCQWRLAKESQWTAARSTPFDD